MPRPPKCRRVEQMPQYNYFKPAGVPLKRLEEKILTVEEIEAIRLKDIENLEQEECAARMEVSRPTFHRIVLAARRKLAEAIIEGKAIRIEGGTFQLVQREFECQACGHRWEVPFGNGQSGKEMACPSCSSGNASRI